MLLDDPDWSSSKLFGKRQRPSLDDLHTGRTQTIGTVLGKRSRAWDYPQDSYKDERAQHSASFLSLLGCPLAISKTRSGGVARFEILSQESVQRGGRKRGQTSKHRLPLFASFLKKR